MYPVTVHFLDLKLSRTCCSLLWRELIYCSTVSAYETCTQRRLVTDASHLVQVPRVWSNLHSHKVQPLGGAGSESGYVQCHKLACVAASTRVGMHIMESLPVHCEDRDSETAFWRPTSGLS